MIRMIRFDVAFLRNCYCKWASCPLLNYSRIFGTRSHRVSHNVNISNGRISVIIRTIQPRCSILLEEYYLKAILKSPVEKSLKFE